MNSHELQKRSESTLQKVDYIITLEELKEIQGRLPKCDEWPASSIKVKVRMGVEQKSDTITYGRMFGNIHKTEYQDFCEIEFLKFRENNTKDIWIYEGKVRL